MTKQTRAEPPCSDAAIPLLALAMIDPFFILRGSILATAALAALANTGPYPIYLPGGQRGWSDTPSGSRHGRRWRAPRPRARNRRRPRRTERRRRSASALLQRRRATDAHPSPKQRALDQRRPGDVADEQDMRLGAVERIADARLSAKEGLK